MGYFINLKRQILSKLGKSNSLENQPFYRKYKPLINPGIVDNAIVISTKYRYIFPRMFKAANSTIVASLYFAETNIRIQSLDELQKIKDDYFTKPSFLKKYELDGLEDYFKFTFVRNPYSRVLSAYLDKIEVIGKPQRHLVLKFYNRIENDKITFDEFLYYLENGGLNENGHWAPQSAVLTIPVSELNFIGKTENIRNDLNELLLKVYERESEIINVREHKTKAKNLCTELPDSTLKRIYKIYEQDFVNFKYSR